MRWLNNSYGRNDPRRGAVAREGVAALDPANGLPYTWNPGRRRGYGVYGFALTEDGLWTGSDTTGFGGRLRGIALCRIATGDDLPPYRTGTLPGRLVTLATAPPRRSLPTRSTAAAPCLLPASRARQNWQNVRGAFVVDDVLYSGWADGIFRAQAFDGTTLGAAAAVDLREAFVDLPDVRAMFFDKVTRRVYYTLRGSSELYYRYFQPQNRLVGSWQYEVEAPSTVDWASIDGAFIVGTRLFATSDGSLSRIEWNSATGTTVGSATDVADEVEVEVGWARLRELRDARPTPPRERSCQRGRTTAVDANRLSKTTARPPWSSHDPSGECLAELKYDMLTTLWRRAYWNASRIHCAARRGCQGPRGSRIRRSRSACHAYLRTSSIFSRREPSSDRSHRTGCRCRRRRPWPPGRTSALGATCGCRH